MRKLARTQMRAFTIAQLARQGGICPLCKKPIDYSIPREAVVDHDHKTGEVRGVLHRACNGAEGKVANAAGRWGAGGMSYDLIIPWLENMIQYLRQPGLGVIYPTHKTEEEKRLAANTRRRKVAATKRAAKQVRAMTPKEAK